jgi:hypothetical protein
VASTGRPDAPAPPTSARGAAGPRRETREGRHRECSARDLRAHQPDEAAAIRAAAEAAPLLALTGRALSDLAEELGSRGAAAEFVRSLVEANDRPIAINIPTGGDTSRTICIAPKRWGSERPRGWIGARHTEFQDAFGPVSRVGAEFPAPGDDA